MKRMGLAVVGAGVMGELHARAVSDCDVTALVSVVDPVVEKAQALADRHGAAHAVDVGPLLTDDRVAGCIVAVPDKLHVDVTLQILAAGKHVFLEKPMAHTLAAAREIATAAERSAGRLTVAHILRHDARFVGAEKDHVAGLRGGSLEDARNGIVGQELRQIVADPFRPRRRLFRVLDRPRPARHERRETRYPSPRRSPAFARPERIAPAGSGPDLLREIRVETPAPRSAGPGTLREPRPGDRR